MAGPEKVGLGHIASQGEDVIHVVSLHLRPAQQKMCACRSSDRLCQAPKPFPACHPRHDLHAQPESSNEEVKPCAQIFLGWVSTLLPS